MKKKMFTVLPKVKTLQKIKAFLSISKYTWWGGREKQRCDEESGISMTNNLYIITSEKNKIKYIYWIFKLCSRKEKIGLKISDERRKGWAMTDFITSSNF